MIFRWLTALISLGFAAVASAETLAYNDIAKPPHNYWQRTPQDRFTRLKGALESGRITLNHTSEKGFVQSLLKALDVPASSQMLVFSTTSLQLRFISPRNPRALYFNEDTHVGWVPGGKIEIVSLDPELGGIYYIMDIPRDGRPPQADRSGKCMNCHQSTDTENVPGILIKSVVPADGGGTLDAMRQGQSGHSVPFDKRFGGWHVTGSIGIAEMWGNVIGSTNAGTLSKQVIKPGDYFNFKTYLAPTSDILPQLLHEHQAGFVNRVVNASYHARSFLFEDKGRLSTEHAGELDKIASELTRYILFADEVPLPAGGVEGDAIYKSDFLRTCRTTKNGQSLRDFDLRTRMFRVRCSYMIYSNVFQGLPKDLKQRVYRRIGEACNAEKPDAEYDYLPSDEKAQILAILRETLTAAER